jgi:hypothetical protein
MPTAGMMIASFEWSPLIPWKWISPLYRRAFFENFGLQRHLLVRCQLQAFDRAWLPAACFPNETISDAPLTSSKTSSTGEAMQSVTNLVLRPRDGCVITVSGRRIPQPPWILSNDQASVTAYQDWLIEQARAEAAQSNYDCILKQLENMTARQVDETLQQLLSDLLFGQPNPVFESRPGSV